MQLDFCTKAESLKRFNSNFKNDPHVLFPKAVNGFAAQPDVLVETFVEGMPVLQFAQKYSGDKALLHEMCLIGIQTVCRMIFYHNFIHADLHPGNIFASVSDGVPKFILVDVGMITEFTDSEHEILVDILANFIRRNGRRAAELMLLDSERRMMYSNEQAVNAEKFIATIENLTETDRHMNFFENIGGYILYICEAAATHHVMLNQGFASIALAVKVQEGVAISLDPNAKVWETANPIIVRAEFRRRITRFFNRLSDEISNFEWRQVLQESGMSLSD